MSFLYLLLTAWCISAEPQSLMDPHVPPQQGPWFEGNYTRLVDPVNKLSFAVITTSYISANESYQQGAPQKAYVAFLYQAKDQSFVTEVFPEKSYWLSAGERNIKKRDFSEITDYKWIAPGLGSSSDDYIDLKLESDDGPIHISIQMLDPYHWGENVNHGPEGPLAFISQIPLHWYVYSINSKARYEVQFPDGKLVRGEAFAHQEKNWGAVFPKAWMWLQAISADGKSHLALAGGILDLPIIRYKEQFLAGYFSNQNEVSFHPSNSYSQVVLNDDCQGEFEIEFWNWEYVMKVSARAPKQSFKILSIPSKKGYLPGAVESFMAEISVELYSNQWLFKEPILIEQQTFYRSALEFGADYASCLL